LGEEEITDVSLATFYVFDKEHARPPPLAKKLGWPVAVGATDAAAEAVAVATPMGAAAAVLTTIRNRKRRAAIC